jgi:hypothetical protein
MYPTILAIHNIVRWLVLIFGVLAFIKALIGWFGGKEWAKLDNQLGLGFTISMDTQVLLGLLLYFIFSPVTKAGFSDFGAAMSDSGVRFFLVEHSFLMIVALALAHVGRSRAKKADTAVAKFKNTAIFFGLSLLAVFVAIPWWRPLLPF